ncbi:type IV pilus twitching motility protein PilT [Desulfoluna butyratoxydans]|uniref:Pilus retraction protein pilt n=1 Tax=Desulfoluna butyratoxydans TaxID=231438 RepID=A0A4U8YPZ8_9BACT|nr:PilT/PilU family type 4a pilus ATPase [Desulfoluna butyratoxydans]VFQ45880.1 pilus retraction protein pilt [Desulfoluna butyratoxydans]
MRKQEMDYILSRMLDSHNNVSDLNLTVGRPLQVESSGKLLKVDLEPDIKELTPFQTEQIAMNLIGQDRRLTEVLIRTGSCDLSYSLPGKARFRVNIFSQSGNYSIVLRRLETTVPSVKELNLPKAFYEIPKLLNGIVFVTGATGTGKTTSLAAVLSEINATRPVHVITLEDPIEYQHAHKMATFNQRELGSDFENFASGLRAALRQAPKVVLVGEMRDKETVEIGLRAAETGHLVLTTLHTNNAGATINRILGMFESEEEKQLRLRLADSVRWIICQRLLPKVGGGRVAAFEILGTSLRVKDLILNGESDGKTYDDVMEQGKHFGMSTFDNYIVQLYEQGLITQETAMVYASHKAVVGRGIDSVKSARGEKTTDIDSLEIDHGYKEKMK